MRQLITLTLLFIGFSSSPAHAFCGLYIAKANTQLFNKSSQVVFVREDQRNIVTMASDYQGKAKDFALIIPVPTVLKKSQIHIIDKALIKHLDDYSAPRLVEYHDSNPCQVRRKYRGVIPQPGIMIKKSLVPPKRARNLGVTIEAKYTVDEYDILLLSARESNGLVEWLTSEGYQLPKGAEAIIGSYLKQDMKFFVAKINLPEFKKTGYTQLRPIQIAYDSKRFMLPIRLGTINAKGKQDLFVYALTRKGQVKTTNYRTVKLPTNIDLPPYIKKKKLFNSFYKAMFNVYLEKHNNNAVFLEYAWNMSSCDPCSAKPLSNKELKKLGVFWLDSLSQSITINAVMPQLITSQPQSVYISRLHLRYDKKSFPADLMFQTTGDQTNFQGRYILHHPFTGPAQCNAGDKYFNTILPHRFSKEAKTLSKLTHWDINTIRKQQKIPKHSNYNDDEDWLDSIWE